MITERKHNVADRRYKNENKTQKQQKRKIKYSCYKLEKKIIQY